MTWGQCCLLAIAIASSGVFIGICVLEGAETVVRAIKGEKE